MSTLKLDPDLGKLHFFDLNGQLAYFCQLTLAISRKKVDTFFETDSEDRLPTSSQKEFLQRVVSNFQEILNLISAELPKDLDAPSDKFPFIKEQFDLDTLGIPLNVDINPKWDLSLKSRTNKSISLLVNFENMTPVKVWTESLHPKPLLFRALLKAFGR